MAVPIMMPRQGQSVESCIITEWVKNQGDQVEKGEVICIYETDKASFELEAPESGEILATFFDADDDVPVLTNIGVIGKPGESIDEFSPEGAPTTEQKETSPETSSNTQPLEDTVKSEPAVSSPSLQQADTGEILKASPRAKNFAQKNGINLDRINLSGSGPEGRIIEQDVIDFVEKHGKSTPLAAEKAKSEELAQPETGTGIGQRIRAEDLGDQKKAVESSSGEDFELRKISNIRKIIAENMHRSLQNSAQLTHHTSADARKLLQLRKEVKAKLAEGGQDNITLNDMVCFAVIRALKANPEANSHFLGDQIKIFHKVNLGIAVDTERGLMVPALKNADELNLGGLSRQLKKVANDCRNGKIDPELLASTAASFTVSNLGAYDIEIFTPVINLPQSGILGVNTIIHRPKDLGDGTIAFVPHIGLSLTYDHRSLDGAPASRFLKAIKDEIENFDYKLD